MGIFKKNKKEIAALDLQNADNQKAAIRASMMHKVPLIVKPNGLFIIDTDHCKEKNLMAFLKQFIEESVNCRQSVIYKEDPKYDYFILYDKEESDGGSTLYL